jgi:uncharacterized repeat protein (TIGR02543 family)
VAHCGYPRQKIYPVFFLLTFSKKEAVMRQSKFFFFFAAMAAVFVMASSAVAVVDPINCDLCQASAAIGSWPCGANGNNVMCTLDEDGMFAVSGSGAMVDIYEMGSVIAPIDDRPWRNYLGSITNVVVENGVTSIAGYAFFNTNLTSITIGNNVASIGQEALGSKLTTINVNTANATYSSVDGILFNKNQTTLIMYPRGKTETSYTIPSGVTTIGATAFAHSRLSSITITSAVTSVGHGAFVYCSFLASITSYAVIPPDVDNLAFSGVNTASPLYVPQGSINAYSNADVWKDFSNIRPLDYTTFTVMFDVQYEVLPGVAVTPPQIIEAGGKATKPNNPTRLDYIFIDWYKEPECTTLWNFTTDVVTSDITLYAKWASTTSVTSPRVSRAKQFSISQNGTNLRLVGTSQSTPIRIYNLNGKLLMSRSAMPNELISVSHLARGTYVLKALGNSVRIIR